MNNKPFTPSLKCKCILICSLLLNLSFSVSLSAQYIPVHPSSDIYGFLKELANEKAIELNSVCLPLGRKTISGLLNSADRSHLNKRQLKELDFYLKDYHKEIFTGKYPGKRKDLFYYRDSSFTITVNPIFGGNYWESGDDAASHWWNGAEAWGSYKKLGLYGSLRDNHFSEFVTYPTYLNRYQGEANFKNIKDGLIDTWESRGGLSYDFGKGSIGLYKDNFTWGNNYDGANIFSGRTPSFVHIAFNLHPVEWFEFRYVHGWLVSEVVDSSLSFVNQNGYGSDYVERYHSKFLAANMFTFRPFKQFHISFGNSIIYDYQNANPAYFIPVMFYKAVDHELNSGIDNMNSQIFFDISSRNIKHTNLYATLFIDELAVKRIFNPKESNFYSFKAGIRLDNLIDNFYAGVEYTVTDALTFRHYVNTLTFESNKYNLGHYLADNAKELCLNAGYRPYRNLDISINYTHALKGPDHTAIGTPRLGIVSFTPVVWQMEQASFRIGWQVINDLYFRFAYTLSNIHGEEDYLSEYTPVFWQGRKNVLELGLNIGF